MEVATEANSDQKSRSNSKLVCSSFHPRRPPQKWHSLGALQGMPVPARSSGVLIYIDALSWDPKMEVAIKWKSLLLFLASIHRPATAGTDRCGRQWIPCLAVLMPALRRVLFLDQHGAFLLRPCTPWAHCHRGEVKALRSQHQGPSLFGLHCHSPTTWLSKNNTTVVWKEFSSFGL